MVDTRKLTRAITYLRAMINGLIVDQTLTGMCPRSMKQSGAHHVQVTEHTARCLWCGRHSTAADYAAADPRQLSTGQDMVLVSLPDALGEPQPVWVGRRVNAADGIARVRVLIELDVFVEESHLTALQQVPGAERTVMRVHRVMRESGDE